MNRGRDIDIASHPDQLVMVLIEPEQPQQITAQLARQRATNETQAWHDFEAASADEQRRQWRRWADCVGHAQEHDATGGFDALAAVRRCQSCPVRQWCAEWVATEPDFIGVAAGRIFRRERARAAGSAA